jgi:hypothetical protein
MLSRQFLLISLAVITVPLSLPSLGLAQNLSTADQPILAQAQAETISEAALEKMVEEVKAAVKSRNLEALLSHFAPFIYSSFTVNAGISAETVRLTGIDEHKGFLETTWRDVSSVEEIDDYVQIRLSGDEKSAILKRSRLVNLTFKDGRKLLVQSDSTSRVAMVGGELKIISIEEIADVDVRP